MLALRRRMQIVFQDPFSSLNPRTRGRAQTSARRSPSTGLGTGESGATARRHAGAGGPRARHLRPLPARVLGRPAPAHRHRPRARAAARLLVADEPVSALDVSVQAQVINLLGDLQGEFGLAMLFVSHDLSVVEYFCDEVIVMYLGRVMERGPAEAIFARPHHPYTRALQAAAPNPDPDAPRDPVVLHGDMPSPVHPPSGCVFHTRCPAAIPACLGERPAEREVGPRPPQRLHPGRFGMITLDTDVLVIGAGPTGAASAWRLATGGRQVTVVDRGRLVRLRRCRT